MLPTSPRPWTIAPAAPAALLAALPEVHPVVVQVLFNRGLATAPAIRAFLRADDEIHDPYLLSGMDRAIVRLRRALARGELVAVHGDFDVDGVTATAVLAEGLRSAGGRVLPYVPLRTTTGYGVHASAIEKLAAEGATLLITGDTGTRSIEAVERAGALGLDVIITDHHVPGAELPPALALLNPKQEACPYPFKALSGVGVAWKLVQALAQEGLLGRPQADDLLDLVALGTIVDVSPLLGENRALVRRGLARLAASPRPGIRALLAQPGVSAYRPRIDERTVSFWIGPRLNAAGRMDDAALALELLLTRDSERAAALVQLLERKNAERRLLTDAVWQQARRQAEGMAREPVLILQGEGWPAGVIGLVAARIAEEFGRPAFVIDVGAEACRGSARSVDGFNLVDVLTACADLLIEYGGHTLAAGFAVRRERLEALAARLLEAGMRLGRAEPGPVVADYELGETELDWALYRALALLRPFGAGNQEPLFASRQVPLLDARAVGADGKHLRTKLRFGRQVLTGFGPNLGAHAGALRPGSRVDALYALDVSTRDGIESLELRLHDIRPA
jgi:single-stranded-DNA-specific exonuclease